MTNLTTEQIIEKIPALKMYESNPDIVRQLYDELNPKRELAELKKGNYVNSADLLVVKVISTSSYVGCPICFSKQSDVQEGVSFQCSNKNCNNDQRIATKLTKWTLLAGDSTSKAVLEFPPFAYRIEDGYAYLAKVVNVRGKVIDVREEKTNGMTKAIIPSIMVTDMKVLSDIRESLESKPLDIPEVPKGTATTIGIFNPPPLPVGTTVTLTPKQQNALSLWMSFQPGPVPEAQLLSYLENNLKATLTDVEPLLNKSWNDASSTNFYVLKGPAITTH